MSLFSPLISNRSDAEQGAVKVYAIELLRLLGIGGLVALLCCFAWAIT